MIGIKIIRRLYSLKNPKFFYCDLVVPLSYGLLNQNKLPDAAKETLREAVRIASQHRAPIAWANSNYLWPRCEEEENQLKVAEANIAGLITAPIIAGGVTNSITEAQSIRQTVIKKGLDLQFRKIAVVVDWPHARSALKIWKHVFPESTIIVISVNGNWHEDHPCFFQCSEARWLLINIVRHFALILLGMKTVSLFHQPMRR
ncbi:MAG: hypothetical protein ABH841_02125 [Candidatus Nealsonbacteria bacterium]